MISKKIIYLVLFLIAPNTAYAYVDPQIFALIWQSIVAFIFGFIVYARLILLKSSNYIKNIFYYAKKLQFNFIANYFFIFLLLLIPILQITSKNKVYFSFPNYLEAFLIMLTIFLIIYALIFLVLHLLKLNKKYTIYFAIITILISYFMNAYEEYIISNYLDYKDLIYFRITSLIIFSLIIISLIFFLIKKNIRNIKIFLFSFIFCLTTITIIDFSQDIHPNATQAKDNWKLEKAHYKKIKIEDNIFFIIADAYISPKYFDTLYPDQNNLLFDALKKKNFYLKKNSFSSYPSTLLSLPSIFNSNYYRDDFNAEDYRKNIRNLDNGLDNSFLINALKKNNYNQNIISCHFEYQTRKKYCKDHFAYGSLLDDLSIVRAIYFYNSFNSLIRNSIKKINLSFFKLSSNNKSPFIKNDENKNDTILKFLDKKIKIVKRTKNNFFNIFFKVPHSPFIVNANCSWKNIPDYENTVNTRLIRNEETRIKGYIDNLNCVNNHLMKLISMIEKYDDQAIIIIIGDNGANIRPFKYFKKLKQKESSSVLMEILQAYDTNGVLLSVGGGSKCLKNEENKKINHPNLFRIILNCGDKNRNNLINNQITVKNLFD